VGGYNEGLLFIRFEWFYWYDAFAPVWIARLKTGAITSPST
jgi:hypothetical protein